MHQRLIEDFARTAAGNPRKIALITEKSQLTYEDLLAMVQVLDLQLKTHGVREGQTLLLESSRGEFCMAFALLLSLRSYTVIFGGLALAVATGVDFDRAIVTEARDDLPTEKQIVIEPDWFAMMGSLPAPDYLSVDGPGGNFVFRTTGTTGTAKFVRTSEAGRIANMRAMALHDPEEYRHIRLVVTSRANISFAMNTYLPVLLGGGDIVILSDHLDRVPQYINLYHATHMVAPPATLTSILETENPGQYLVSLKEVFLGGAPATERLLRAFSEICPARLVLSYGASEIGAVCKRIYAPDVPYRSDYLGEIFRDDLEIVFFGENLEPLPGANEGNIGFRSRHGVESEYLASAQVDGQAGLHGAFFLPGDICRREGNALFFVGRVKNIVNMNGDKYALEAIRRVLEREFATAEFLPVALRGEDGADELVIAYVADRELAVADISRAVQAGFPHATVKRCHRLERMPLTENGKIDVGALMKTIATAPD